MASCTGKNTQAQKAAVQIDNTCLVGFRGHDSQEPQGPEVEMLPSFPLAALTLHITGHHQVLINALLEFTPSDSPAQGKIPIPPPS